MESDAELLERQFGEALFATSHVPVESGRLADVGTGAGFPGLALRIFAEELQLLLIEQNKKKCVFLKEAARFLDVAGAQILNQDYRALVIPRESLDFVTAKALGDYGALLAWSKSVLRPRGRVVLWLGAEDANSLAATLGWEWKLPIPIPHSKRRVLLVGSPAR